MKKSVILSIIGFVCDTDISRITIKNPKENIVTDICHYVGIMKKHDEPLETLQEVLKECNRLYIKAPKNARPKIKNLHGITYALILLLDKAKYENTIFAGNRLTLKAENFSYVLKMLAFYIDSLDLSEFVGDEISHIFSEDSICKISRYGNIVGIECPKKFEESFYKILATAHNVYNLSVFVCNDTMHFTDKYTEEVICIYFIDEKERERK